MSLSLKLLTYTIFMYALILQKCFLIVYIVYIANIILIVNILLQLGWCQSVWYMKTIVDKHDLYRDKVGTSLGFVMQVLVRLIAEASALTCRSHYT